MSHFIKRRRLADLRELLRRVGDEILALEQEIESETREWGQRAPCGTEKAYRQHRHYGEPKDDACKAAHAAHERLRNPPKVRGRNKPRQRAS